jgi:hypothetical protein
VGAQPLLGATGADRVRDRRSLRLDPERQHRVRRRGARIFGAYTIFDFGPRTPQLAGRRRRIAAGIFLDIFNVFLLALELFGGSRD